MKPGTRYGLAGAVLAAVIVASAAVSLWLSAQTVGRAQRQWCDTLGLLTSQPVAAPKDPASNPSREGQYRFYVDLVALKHRFGC